MDVDEGFVAELNEDVLSKFYTEDALNEYYGEDRAVYVEVEDFDRLYDTLEIDPAIVNNYDVTRKEDKELLNMLLMTTYEGESLSSIPRCGCGNIKGGDKLGKFCPRCLMRCNYLTEQTIESLLWIEAPEDVDGLINPAMLVMLSNLINGNKKPGLRDKENPLKWLLDPYYKPRKPNAKRIVMLNNMQIPRGLNHFIRNWREILTAMFDKPGFLNAAVRRKREVYMRYFDANAHKFFPKRLPIPSRLSFIVEKSAGMQFSDTFMLVPIDVARTFSEIGHSADMSQKSIMSTVAKSMYMLADFYSEYSGVRTGKKTRILRRHVFGSRSNMTARGVITPITGPHRYDDLVLPWGMAVLLYKVHLKSLLLHRGYTPAEAETLISGSVRRYNPTIDALFQEMASTGMGMKVKLQRNPSMERGSAQLFNVPYIRKDVTIYTIGLSPLVLKGFNGDYDGDELNVTAIQDKGTLVNMKRLMYHLTLMDMTKPWAFSKNCVIPEPTMSTFNRWRQVNGSF